MFFLKISIFWKVCWSITPVILTAIFVIAIIPPYYEAPTYQGSQETIYYPEWAHHIGWFLTLVSAMQIPLIAIFMVVYDDDFRAEVEEFFHEMDRDFDGRLSFEVLDFIFIHHHIVITYISIINQS